MQRSPTGFGGEQEEGHPRLRGPQMESLRVKREQGSLQPTRCMERGVEDLVTRTGGQVKCSREYHVKEFDLCSVDTEDA